MGYFKVILHYHGSVHEVGYSDADKMSMIVVYHALAALHFDMDTLPDGEFSMRCLLPWCGGRVEITSDSQLLEVCQMCEIRQCETLVFEIEDKPLAIDAGPPSNIGPNLEEPYIPDPPVVSPSTLDEQSQEGVYDYNPSGWNDMEEDILAYMGDSENVDGSAQKEDDVEAEFGAGVENNETAEVEGVSRGEGVPMGEDVSGGEGACKGEDECCKVDANLLEGYKSGDSDEFDLADSEINEKDSKIDRLMKCKPFERMVDGQIEFHVGETHDNVYTLRKLLQDYAIQDGVSLARDKNSKEKLIFTCKGEGCKWRIYARVMLDNVTMKVKSYNGTHCCSRMYRNEEAKVSWIASKFEALVKSNPSIGIGVIADLLREKFRVTVDKHRLYNAKNRALVGLLKDHTECFKKLNGYKQMVRVTNPGSVVYCRLQQPEPTFHRFFLCFNAQKEGFIEGCIHLIGVDGCHQKGPYGGVLLSAVSLDANNGIFPLAVCICEAETIPSWTWFLGHLKQLLQWPDERPIFFMSDRQKEVVDALNTHWPHASNRRCARHIYANFRRDHSGSKLKSLFWQAVRTCQKSEYRRVLNEIGDIKSEAKKWLLEIDPELWSRWGFGHRIKCDHVTNNLSESFNNMLGEHRCKQYLSLLEYIRRMVMQKFQQRKNEASKWNSEVPPAVYSTVIKATKLAREHIVLEAGNGVYEVLGPKRAYVAKTHLRTCECGEWQLSGVPCCHVIAGIGYSSDIHTVSQHIQGLIDPYLTKTSYIKTYQGMINPIADPCAWLDIDEPELIPPPVSKKPGRPKMQRIREAGEKQKGSRSGSVVCTKCMAPGHNKRTCKADQVPLRKKRKRQNRGKASTSQPIGPASVSSSQPPTQTQPQSQVDLE